MSIEEWRKAKSDTGGAKAYLALIGKRSEDTTARHSGSLTKFTITTQVHYQPYDGAKNYHDCPAFDAALTEVVRARWSEIRDEAMELLAKREAKAAVAAKASVQGLLAEIEAAQATADQEASA